VTALGLGAGGFITVTVAQPRFWAQPNWRLSVPFFVVTLVAAAISLVRKEPSYALPLLGLGLAAAAMVLGWFFVTAAVVIATGLVILIMSHAL
jgi:lipopolysaccharide export LptBFGC system permease protein LptF